MPFVSNQKYPGGTVGPDGPKDGLFCFVGEAPARNEFKQGKPFVGEAGTVLDHCLQSAGIVRSMNYITNFIKEYVGKDGIAKYVHERTKPPRLTDRGLRWQKELADELKSVTSPIIITLGGPATLAVTGQWGITQRRGYVTEALQLFDRRPVMPTLHPASCLYGAGNYIGKYYIQHDLVKASNLLLRRDEVVLDILEFDRTEVRLPVSVGEVEAMRDEIRRAGVFAFDIEASRSSNFEISCIGFATEPNLAYSVLLADPQMWTEDEELAIWRLIASLLEDPNLVKVGQNLLFDMHFIMMHQGIFTKPPIVDTMVGHHIVYPDFLKSLGFLASIYTHRPYWKDMVKFKGKHKGED